MNILFLAYYFPPDGGGGSQRPAKFAKYLTKSGVSVTVLTCEKEKPYFWRPVDKSIMSTTDKIEIIAISEKEWKEALLERIKLMLKKTSFDALIITMSPFNVCELSTHLKNISKTKIVLDFRDPWIFDENHLDKTHVSRFLNKLTMLNSVKKCDLCIMNTPESKKILLKHLPSKYHDKIVVITNGYDEEDFNQFVKQATTDITVFHSGTFHTSKAFLIERKYLIYRLIGKMSKNVNFWTRTPRYLLDALSLIKTESPTLYKNLKCTFAGIKSEEDKLLIDKSAVAENIIVYDYVKHSDAVTLLKNADILFFPMQKPKDGSRTAIVPGKLYEYMAVKKPILAPIPNGDARDFLKPLPNAFICEPDDPQDIKEKLLAAIASRENIVYDSKYDNYIEKFSRKSISNELLMHLGRII